MPRFAANLSMLFTEQDFLARFKAAADAGFQGVEYLFPYEFSSAEIKAQLDANGLTQVLFNLPAGDWAKGERGLACHRIGRGVPCRGQAGHRLRPGARQHADQLPGGHPSARR